MKVIGIDVSAHRADVVLLDKFPTVSLRDFYHSPEFKQVHSVYETNQIQDLVKKAYSAFNSRDIDTALSTFHAEVEWPKAFEGGYVSGHDAIRAYWTRQWTEINPNVEPIGFKERKDGTFEITVHQFVKDLQGDSLFDGIVKHIYTVEDGLLRKMAIRLVTS